MSAARPRIVASVRRSGAAPFVLAVSFALAGLAGCVSVAPHERGVLARKNMILGGSADLTVGEEHAQAYREGSIGGGSARGGGCGCN